MIQKLENRIIVVISGLLLVIGIVVLIVARGDEDTWIKDGSGNWVMHGNPAINDFESCANKYPVMETYPERCQIPDGPSFTKIY